MAFPASERATHRWLRERSAAGELLGVDFETMGAMQLYRASDALMAHRGAIEAHLFDAAMGLFDLEPTVTLYDLTNTYFEGAAAAMPKAACGHSKEKRSDCPLLTLGLVLDAGGFVRRSQVFAGSVREHETLEGMLAALGAPAGALVVMDRGIATGDRVDWLRAAGYRYLVVSRERRRRFDADAAVAHGTRTGGRCIAGASRLPLPRRILQHRRCATGRLAAALYETRLRTTNATRYPTSLRSTRIVFPPPRLARGRTPVGHVTGRVPTPPTVGSTATQRWRLDLFHYF